jgi:hypothetical protein
VPAGFAGAAGALAAGAGAFCVGAGAELFLSLAIPNPAASINNKNTSPPATANLLVGANFITVS